MSAIKVHSELFPSPTASLEKPKRPPQFLQVLSNVGRAECLLVIVDGSIGEQQHGFGEAGRLFLPLT